MGKSIRYQRRGRSYSLLRAGSVADIDGLLELWRQAAEYQGRPADTREALSALFDRDPDAVIVAEHDGELIGSVIAGWTGGAITCTGSRYGRTTDA